MSRPGFVLEVDERTPALLVHEGEGFRLERFPLGTRVIYPPESLPGIRNVDAAIARALANPIDCEPLSELLAQAQGALRKLLQAPRSRLDHLPVLRDGCACRQALPSGALPS